MERWITADLHLGHTNIITYSGRPFRDADEMDDSIVERWNEVVAPTDRVLVLGDVAMGRIDRTLGASARLHGYKVLLTGNHDRCAALHGRKAVGWDERYRRDGGFAEIHQGTMRIDLDADHRKVLACHFPYGGGLNRSPAVRGGATSGHWRMVGPRARPRDLAAVRPADQCRH
jgi:calcineurin-like phosphoesterase family protein